ncbi:hypothetical protein EW145_g5168 [Phellinidium pouzarii]|uniref:VWFA domain-containing protein n=1 Tax=Phellinidium pouzarii TaxID=167371 RepID=A0A4S4L0V6_9AGAM|nr:hypothetical protein EW145_g5168 [Phellinidium pouzarii]
MPLEATMMIVDNSEYMRNGDFLPTRFDAMVDALNVVFQTKTDSNPENSVGLMTLAGHGPEVLVTHTRELGHILAGAHNARVKIGGAVDLPTAVNVAQLALKHRQNKNLRQRIVLFLGSPPDGPGTDEKNFTRLAKKLKKNNIAIDIVAFGDGIEEGETSLLEIFVNNVNSGDNSHYITVPSDPRRTLSDFVISSAVLSSDRGDRDQTMAEITNTAGPSADGTFGEFGGIDPSLDPELAMVMRMSMEEERARQRAQEQAAAGGASAPAEDPDNTSVPSAPSSSQHAAVATAPIPNVNATDEADDEEAALREALRLSQEEDVEMGDGANLAAAATGSASTATGAGGGEDMDEDEEAAIARAIEMSMQQPEKKK